jgi:hypothetical protein
MDLIAWMILPFVFSGRRYPATRRLIAVARPGAASETMRHGSLALLKVSLAPGEHGRQMLYQLRRRASRLWLQQ